MEKKQSINGEMFVSAARISQVAEMFHLLLSLLPLQPSLSPLHVHVPPSASRIAAIGSHDDKMLRDISHNLCGVYIIFKKQLGVYDL